ncbi:MAG: Hpt domain-containing protein, partial [Gammaproteobacteria bacterium]|nr:Hpt domain-containing protein [Gammaproteobacteria bacterium]
MDFKHTSIKQSALGWVKKSIDDNLATIRSELNIFVEEKDVALLTSVQTKLTDIQGVLTMIEQYGAAMLTEEMRSLCEFIATNNQEDEQALEVLLRAVLQLPDYLEHIQAGQKDIPIAILPTLNDIRAAKNEDLFSEKLLFLPDLSMHMDDSEIDAIDENSNQASRLLAKKIRPAYQFSLLGVIRDKDVDIHLKRLEKITEILEDRSSSEQVARFWWIVGALIESVSRGDLSLGMSVKMLLGKIDAIFRSMIQLGEKDLLQHQPIELIKNFLYYIAQPECNGSKSQAIKTAYRLEQFLPAEKDQNDASFAGPNQELLKTVSDAIKADLEQVKSSLEVYVNSDMSDTTQLQDIPQELHVISDTLAMIGLGPQRQIIEAQITTITEVIEGKATPDQDKFLDMAAELLQVDQALEMMHKGQFIQQDETEETGQAASKNFEMDNMLSGVVTAALDDIQKIKDAILDFIKDSTKAENLQLCKTLLLETRGALALLNQDRAVVVVEGLAKYLDEQDVVEFMDTRRLDQLSQVVVSIEYFLEALGEQRSDADSILDFADSQLQLLLEGKSEDDDITQSLDDHENLLIADDSDEDVEVIDDATSLMDVNLDNMEAELQDQVPDDDSKLAEPQAVSNVEVNPIEERVSQETMDSVVSDINADLEEIHDTLDSPQDDVPDSSGLKAEVMESVHAESEIPVEKPEVIALSEETSALVDEIIEDDFEAEAVEDLTTEPVLETEEDLLEDNLEVDFELDSEPNQALQGEEPQMSESVVLEETTAMDAVSENVQEQWDDAVNVASVPVAAAEVEESSEEPDGAQVVSALDESENFISAVDETLDPIAEEPVVPDTGIAEGTESDIPSIEAPSSEAEFVALEGEPSDIQELPLEQISETEMQAVEAARLAEAGVVQIEPVIDDMPVLKPDSDPDILEIYLEEAEEESENIRQQQQDWKLHPEDENALKNIRRSFHTIKGSGRLVGAMKIGEFAWDYENLLNRIIDKSVEPSSQVIDAVGLSAEALPQLVEELKTEKPPTADIPYLRGLARALAEFKADKVLEIRKTKHQAVDQAAEVISAEQDNEDITDEPEPAVARQEPKESLQDLEPGTATGPSQKEAADHNETEETPPDPFVLSEAEPMPVEEAGADLAPSQQAVVEAEVPTVDKLQLDPELLVIYQQEVESHLNTVNSVLDQDEGNGELIPTEDLYRALHTIHGASRTASITSIGQLASLLEKPLKIILEQGTGLDQEVLQLYREGSAALSVMTSELVEQRQLPQIPGHLQEDLEALMDSMDNHTVELPDQEDQPSNQFIDTLTMMNEAAAASTDSEYDDELVEIFIEEATDLLEMSDHTLHAWAEQDETAQDADYGLVMELQRYLHTLKGGAKMAGFNEISDLSHELESLFIALIDNRVEKSEDLVAG